MPRARQNQGTMTDRRPSNWRRATWWAVGPLSLLALTGCPWVDSLTDELGTCHDTPVALVNSEQSIDPVHILVDDELATPESRLESGDSRIVTLCLERGRGYAFRSESDQGPLATVRCPSSVAEYTNQTPEVVWTPVGFRCIDW
jgi:hypothetical protein